MIILKNNFLVYRIYLGKEIFLRISNNYPIKKNNTFISYLFLNMIFLQKLIIYFLNFGIIYLFFNFWILGILAWKKFPIYVKNFSSDLKIYNTGFYPKNRSKTFRQLRKLFIKNLWKSYSVAIIYIQEYNYY